ncbi:MAG: hypothetical protein R3B09_01570 [Nannocystaceae bacterium]
MGSTDDDAKSTPSDPGARRPRRRLRGLVIAAQVLVGLGLGAVITELAFSSRDDGAFPHVNFYVADPELGVRLEPGATMRFQLRENPLSTIHVNSQGYRGGEWPAPGQGELIVVGDSQVFGLGVDDDATFSAVLSQKTGTSVINGGVPTYGPAEYMAVAGELLERRGASTVVVVLNFVNDPFEIDRPNRERHAVWDGWAVRSETAPESVVEFPGRRWLFSRSHAVYALRRWLHERGAASDPEAADLGDPVDLGTPSEGGWQELAAASKRQRDEVIERAAAADTALAGARERLGKIDGEITEKRDALDDLIGRASEGQFDYHERRIARGSVGDIIDDERSEASRSVQLTAAMIRKAAQEREKHLKKLLEREAKKGAMAGADAARALIADEERLRGERAELRAKIAAGVPPEARPPALFHDYLTSFKALTDRHGAELVVVALPIDVQVDPQEWAKYGIGDAPDMSESMILLEDLMNDAEDLGLRALDATEALRAAEPGAFLDHDIHMTAKGHAALADALAAALASARESALKAPAPGLPERRTFAPTADEWLQDDEVKVSGSTAAGCSTQIRREWLRIHCRRQKLKDRFDGVEVIAGGTPATMAMRTPDSLSLVTPLTIGVDLTARFHWKGASRELQIRWPIGDDGKAKFVGQFVDVPAGAAPTPAEIDPAVARLCECHHRLTFERWCEDPGDYEGFNDYDSYVSGCQDSCAGLFGDPALVSACDVAQAAAPAPAPTPKTEPAPAPTPKQARGRFAGGLDLPSEQRLVGRPPAVDACARLVACVQNDPLVAPTCPEGQVHAFASNACFALCDDAHPCATGACTEWRGAGVCVAAEG